MTAVRPREATTRQARPRRSASQVVLLLFGLAVFVFLFLPIAYIVVFSFNTGRLLQVWEGFGVDSYTRMAGNDTMRQTIWVSIRAGVGAALVSTVLGALAGVALARRPGRWSPVFVALLALVLVTPEIVAAVSLLPWFVTLGTDAGLTPLNGGLVRLVIGHSLFATAVVTFIVRARMQGIDESLEEAAADLYATPWRRFREITLPLMMPAVLAGALMSFTLSLDNTIVSAFVQVSGSTPWPVYVLSSLRSSLRPEIAAMSTVMLLLTLASLALVALVLRRSGDSAGRIVRTMGGG
ncbi:ABC transporter permease [Pseudonocardia nigra]|uniref:ABC transporter permease n=1 Tax=Pseudonocardia nigra TaxID=1921578 RepID=UPI001C5E130B|nr:ABC transporter permease [Pseudonocardia nigra]